MEKHTADLRVLKLSNFEVETSAEKLKRYMSPGTDQIPTEVVQVGGETLHSKMHNFINTIWNMEEICQQQKESVSIPIYRKGDKTECGNY
jgi:hypothetical protein